MIERKIEDVQQELGDWIGLVTDRIRQTGSVRILEAGCGRGLAMMGHCKRFGDQVAVYGFNYSEHDGTTAIMKQRAVETGVCTPEEITAIPLPEIRYCDASAPLPFESDSFDFIYSIASVYLYDDKVHFLQECNRILRPNGIARLSLALHFRNEDAPPEYSTFMEIWDKGRQVPLKEYFERFNGVRFVEDAGELGSTYVQIQKQPSLDFKLTLVSAVNYNSIWHEWGGVKSIYTTQRRFIPRYRRNALADLVRAIGASKSESPSND